MDITSDMDAMYWGILTSTMLFGITVTQGWTYANNNNDRWYLRLLVTVLVLLDFSITCLTSQALRYYLMSNFGDAAVLPTLPRTTVAIFSITVAVIFLNTLFFASRIYILNKGSVWVMAIISIVTTGMLVTGALSIESAQHGHVVSTFLSPHTKLLLGIALGFSMLTMISTTISLMRPLSNAHTSIKRTQTVLQRLLLFLATRGVLVAVNTMVLLITFFTGASNLNWMPFLLFTSKFHVISMVAMLNARTHIAPPSETGLITIGDIGSSGRTFTMFMRKPADASDGEPQAIQINTPLDGEHSHPIQPIPSFLPQADTKHGDILKVNERVLAAF